MAVNSSKIEIRVTLDNSQVPERLEWKADQGASPEWQEAKAFILGIFDEKSRDTLKIDLWTKNFQMIEMDRFMYHHIRSLADTYLKATNNKEIAEQMQQFAKYFGEKTQIIKAS